MEHWSTITVRVDSGDKPSVNVDVADPETYNTSVSWRTERGDELTLWFEDPRHLQMWVLGLFAETKRFVDVEAPRMLEPVADDPAPPAPVDAARYSFGVGR